MNKSFREMAENLDEYSKEDIVQSAFEALEEQEELINALESTSKGCPFCEGK